MDIGIDIQGLKDVEKALVSLSKEVGSKKTAGLLTSSMRKRATIYEETIRETAPESEVLRFVKKRNGEKVQIQPGFMKSRIKTRASTNRKAIQSKKFGKNVVSLVRVGVFRVPYVAHVEWGTRNMKSNPFIRRAFESRKDQVVSEIVKTSQKKVERLRRRLARQKAQK